MNRALYILFGIVIVALGIVRVYPFYCRSKDEVESDGDDAKAVAAKAKQGQGGVAATGTDTSDRTPSAETAGAAPDPQVGHEAGKGASDG